MRAAENDDSRLIASIGMDQTTGSPRSDCTRRSWRKNNVRKCNRIRLVSRRYWASVVEFCTEFYCIEPVKGIRNDATRCQNTRCQDGNAETASNYCQSPI